MRRKGFTLVELLVVIAIIAMLLAILMPALNRVKMLAYRVVCGSNLRSLGQAITLYAGDFDEEYPIAGDANTIWDWKGSDVAPWATEPPGPNGPGAPVGSSMYLLVKYAAITPDTFRCKGGNEKKFQVKDYIPNPDLTKGEPETDRDCFNFGSPADVYLHVSYAYHIPYHDQPGGLCYALSAMSPAGMALMADKNPWLDSRGGVNLSGGVEWTRAGDRGFIDGAPDNNPDSKWNKENLEKGNSRNHAQEGQNVMFNDTHVSFESGPNCGINKDNIYATWFGASDTANPTRAEREGGSPTGQPSPPETYNVSDTIFPLTEEDSMLINDGKIDYFELL